MGDSKKRAGGKFDKANGAAHEALATPRMPRSARPTATDAVLSSFGAAFLFSLGTSHAFGRPRNEQFSRLVGTGILLAR
jgi:hypothetical protein